MYRAFERHTRNAGEFSKEDFCGLLKVSLVSGLKQFCGMLRVSKAVSGGSIHHICTHTTYTYK